MSPSNVSVAGYAIEVSDAEQLDVGAHEGDVCGEFS